MAALLFISFIVLLLIGVPVAFAIAAAALLVLLKGDVKLLILVQRMFVITCTIALSRGTRHTIRFDSHGGFACQDQHLHPSTIYSVRWRHCHYCVSTSLLEVVTEY